MLIASRKPYGVVAPLQPHLKVLVFSAILLLLCRQPSKEYNFTSAQNNIYNAANA
jgi:hypothetical protein